MIKPFKFYGGVHPREDKVSSQAPIAAAPLMPYYTVPLQMHLGAPAKPVVQKGDKVRRGQLLAVAGGTVSASVHSPTSGSIKDFGVCLSLMGTHVPAFTVESDGEDLAAEPLAVLDWQTCEPEALRLRVAEAGVVGMGGAAFPSAVKLSPPPSKPIDTLIINGVECEPCLTADHRLMMEFAREIITGIRIIARILGAKTVLVGIEDNKMDAVSVMTAQAVGTEVAVRALQVRYPQGAEKQLIYALTKRKVPSGGLPMDIGCVVLNVSSSKAVFDAVCQGKPLYERITTVTGTPLVSPGNWLFRIGTPLREAIRLAGGIHEDPAKIIAGGPMMGFSVYSLDIPISKNTSGILLMSADEVNQYKSFSCLRCGRCNDTCPMQLMPGILSVQIEKERFELADDWHVLDCMECGCCAYVCPASRPLVQHMRRAKTEVLAKRRSEAAKKKG